MTACYIAHTVHNVCFLPPQAGRSPQHKALHASAHLRSPPASAKTALRFPSPTRAAAPGRHGQAQQAAAAAAQATSRVMSGFGHVAAKLGFSGFFGGAPAANRPAGTHEAHPAAASVSEWAGRCTISLQPYRGPHYQDSVTSGAVLTDYG